MPNEDALALFADLQFDPAIAAISTTQMVIAIAMLLVVQRLTGLHHIIGQQR